MKIKHANHYTKCKPNNLNLNKFSGTSDTGSIENANRKGTEKILQESLLFSDTGGGGGGEEINLTSPNSPELLYPNSPRKTHADPSLILNTLRIKNSERIIIGHLNVNHIENKFEPFVSLVKDKLDIIVFSETKIDESFPSDPFAIEGYAKPFRRDRNIHGGGLLIYVRDDIPCMEVKSHLLPDDIESIFIEINLRNKKWILMGAYNPHKEDLLF